MTGEKPKKNSMSNLMLRIAAAAVLVPIALFAAWMGGLVFAVFATILGVLMALEWTSIVYNGQKIQRLFFLLSAIIAGLTPFLFPAPYAIGMIAVLWLVSISAKFTIPESKWHVLGVPYIALPLLALVLIRADEAYGLIAIVLIFTSVWTADSLAYFAGRTFGGPKLWPSISPNKTWSGFFGAVFGGMLASVLVFYFAGLNNLAMAAILGAAIGGLEQGGDLFESAAKRQFGVKDSGTIIPGHGGVLDRVDGLMAGVVAAWIFGAIRAGSWDQAASGLMNWSG